MTKTAHSDEEVAIYRRIAGGDIAARNTMVEEHIGLIGAISKYYARRNPHLDLEDIRQEGKIGIIHALSKFNVDKGYAFSTYATYWIKHYMQRYVVENHSLGPSTSRKDTEAYISERMSKDEVDLYTLRCISSTSLSEPLASGDNYDDVLPDPDDDLPEDIVMEKLDWDRLVVALNHDSIDEKQRRVVCLRFGVLGCEQHTVPQVARLMGCTAKIVAEVEQGTIDAIIELMEE